MSAKRYIKLSPEEDEQLRKVEQAADLRAKVRLRATILRLSNQSWDIERLVSYTGRSRWSILRDFDRWEAQGVEGLADGIPPGNPLQVTEEVRAFLREKLAEDRTWNAAQLADEVAQRFKLQVHPQTIRSHLHLMGCVWKRSRYVPARAPDPEAEHAARARPGDAEKGARAGKLCLKYLDECGVSLCLSPTYTWSPRGKRLRVRTRWGSKGRCNLIGTWSLQGEQQLEYRFLPGSCYTQDVIAYLDALATQAEQSQTFPVVVLDNAPFHRAREVQKRRPSWEERGLYLRYLPSYCPHLNLTEGVWRHLKGFLMPRRYYDSLAALKDAVLSALAVLKAVEVQG